MLNLSSQRFAALYRSNPRDWRAEDLAPCTQDELTALSKLLGIAHSGTKAEQAARLIDIAALRAELAGWGEYDGDSAAAWSIAGAVAKQYSRPQLVALAKRAGTYYSIPKPAIVVALLGWRDACRQRGQQFNAALTAAKRARPTQLVMRII